MSRDLSRRKLTLAFAFASWAAVGIAQQPDAATAIKRHVTIKYTHNDMETGAKELGKKIGVPIEVLHADLELEGIVRGGGTHGLDETDRPADEILRRILKIRDKGDDKLVYVIKSKSPGEPDMIFITTRYAVKKRGDKLPPEYARGGDKPATAK